MKKILITGANSYIGNAVERWLNGFNGKNGGEPLYSVTVLDMLGDAWRKFDFKGFDVVFHVAGIAHDTKKKRDKELYYKVNRDLAIETANKAKESGVGQFIFMSSMLVYNGCKDRYITAETQPKVKGCYGDSKLQADLALQEMNSENFKVAVLRPPMIYGQGCKGNFPRLAALTKKTFIFPKIKNQRSMLYIDNLCEFVRLMIDHNSFGVFFPQNKDYLSSTEIVRLIAARQEKKIWFTRLFNPFVYFAAPLLAPVKKLFGNLAYDQNISDVFDGAYRIVDTKESIIRSV